MRPPGGAMDRASGPSAGDKVWCLSVCARCFSADRLRSAHRRCRGMCRALRVFRSGLSHWLLHGDGDNPEHRPDPSGLTAVFNRLALRRDVLRQFAVELCANFDGRVDAIAILAMPSSGSQPIASSRSATATVPLFGVPFTRPPVFLPSAMHSALSHFAHHTEARDDNHP
jgi:hypothetical protein